MLFPKALFLASAFPTVAKNSILNWIFIKIFQDFLKNSKQFVVGVQTNEKLTHVLLNFLEKYTKIMDFRNFSNKLFENFLKISQELVFSSKRAKG